MLPQPHNPVYDITLNQSQWSPLYVRHAPRMVAVYDPNAEPGIINVNFTTKQPSSPPAVGEDEISTGQPGASQDTGAPTESARSDVEAAER